MKKQMKRLVLMLCLTVPLAVSAQKITWMVKGGPSINNVWSGLSGGDTRFGGRFGIGLEYQVNRTFSIQPSLMMSFKGNKSTNEKEVIYYDQGNVSSYKYDKKTYKYGENYLEIPIDAQFRIHFRKNNSLTFAVGPYFAYGIGGKTKYSRIYAYEKFNPYENQLVNYDGNITYTETVAKYSTFGREGANLHRFDMGINEEIHFEFNRFMLGVYTEYGLLKLDKNHESNELYNFLLHGKNVSYGLDLGYRF